MITQLRMADSRTAALITNIKLLNEEKLENKVIGTDLNKGEALIKLLGLKKGSYLENVTPYCVSLLDRVICQDLS